MSEFASSAEKDHQSCAPKWGKLLTAEEVAAYLRCHVSTVYDLVRGGRLQGFSLTGNTQRNKRGKKGLRILASSVNDLVTNGLNELARPVRYPPSLAETEPVAVTALPRTKTRPTRPSRGRGSRVMLPFPAETS
jgi:excisionase family DNA binding protein